MSTLCFLGTTGGLVMRCEVGWSFEDFRFGGGMRLVELSQTTSQFIISPIRLLFWFSNVEKGVAYLEEMVTISVWNMRKTQYKLLVSVHISRFHHSLALVNYTPLNLGTFLQRYHLYMCEFALLRLKICVSGDMSLHTFFVLGYAGCRHEDILQWFMEIIMWGTSKNFSQGNPNTDMFARRAVLILLDGRDPIE
jgi:hypothetical protein